MAILRHAALACVAASSLLRAQSATLPLRQSSLDASAPKQPLTLRDVSRNDRFIGVGARDARWSPDGAALYFRWNPSPKTTDDPEGDPWYQVDRLGTRATRLTDSAAALVPAAEVSWSRDGRMAAWASRGALFVYDATVRGGASVRAVVQGAQPVRNVRIAAKAQGVDFMMGDDLYRWDASGALRRLTRVVRRNADARTDVQKFQERQQEELLASIRDANARAREAARLARSGGPVPPQPIPVADGVTVDDLQLTPDGRFVTVRTHTSNRKRQPTLYMDFVTASGYAEAKTSRGKVGEPRDAYALGIVRVDPRVDPDSVAIRWVTIPEAGARPVVIHGPYWSLEGDRAVVEAVSDDVKDAWIARLDVESARTTVIDHQHDDAWLGGPPVQIEYTNPGLVEWLPGGRLAFASERTGWSHLYLAEPNGEVRALTSGAWEVRGASLSRDGTTWLLRTSREHPSDDELYTMPAGGGQLLQLTTEQGRSEGVLSPDGKRVAVIWSRNDRLPDLYLRDASASARTVRVTESGSDVYWTHRWLRPEIVSIKHPDGRVVWAGLYKPEHPSPTHAAVVYVHGGGYRQFAHRGWSVYGYSHASHYGMLNWLVQEGYTVLDFDYRGSAGYGRDYRTDIYRSMGAKDVDGAVAAARWLAQTQNVDSTRIGIYGVSYGGFMTLMSLFRYPGVFAAGVAAAAVTDWAHYSDEWTSRILNLPYGDPEAYRASSPIYHAAGLKDHLLIEHGLVDDNVEFQDAARLEQRLLELEKPFEQIHYPLEAHVIEGEPALYDFHKRLTGFFERYLLRESP